MSKADAYGRCPSNSVVCWFVFIPCLLPLLVATKAFPAYRNFRGAIIKNVFPGFFDRGR
jgi:hypothetical protein